MKATVVKKLLWLVFYSLPLVAFSANLTKPRAEEAQPRNSQSDSMPVKVIIYKFREAQPAGRSAAQGISARRAGGVAAAQAVKTYVESQARQYGVDPSLAVWITRHESQFNPRARGDGDASRGLWQISKIYHPEVSDEVAFDVASSTRWSLGQIRAGKAREWSTYHFCRTLYKDCPY